MSDTAPVRPGLAFDEATLARWMDDHVAGFAGPLTVTQFKGGQSNPTYRLDTPAHAYVLRRKPPGTLLKGAHAVEREARLLKALAPTGFPVARVHGLCEDETVIGTAFYVMDMVAGRIFWDSRLPELARDERARVYDAMNATIARLHGIDPVAVGLGDYGRPGNYFERQIARWSAQYAADADEAGRSPEMEALIAWLEANVPAGEETRIVHGDYRCDNMIFDPARAEVRAVLDWELSTLGHPLADFAYHAMMYRLPPAFPAGLAGVDLAAAGIPSEAEYVAAYRARTGRAEIAHWDFYIAFNMFRIAGILHGIAGRVARGTAASAEAKSRADAFPALAALAWKQARHAGAG